MGNTSTVAYKTSMFRGLTFSGNAAALGRPSVPGTSTPEIFTDTEYTDDDRGVPIYWVGGGRVAADYADFYDGDWENETSPTDVNGRPYPLLVGPWTGSANDGTELVEGGVSRALGESLVGYGAPGATAPGAGPLHSGSTAANTEVRPLYVLTTPVEVGFSLLVSNRSQYEYFIAISRQEGRRGFPPGATCTDTNLGLSPWNTLIPRRTRSRSPSTR